ncbi:MAG: ABC transporter substrate-binding protein [Methylibium sp.]|uniref:ABC transporter substrate-binding protein n=1 Tax=Methylibium sp. TaxID=2067992 RepID=UPI00184457F5|nr:ABC transporter substrate-binding protein [Methylibium sp.]MBA3599132.1 ABC transporter substrate-binding protein [Methylibium sp.]
MGQIRTLTAAGVLVLFAAASAQAQAPARQAIKPVRVGLIAPLTGGSADFGNSVRLGAELAVKEINEAGGYLGRPFELVIRDDKAIPDEGRKAAENLVLEEKVDFTLGYCNTGVAMKSIEVFQKNKHLLMVPCSQGTAVTAMYPAAQSYIFRVAPKDLINAQFLVGEIVDRRQLRKVALFADTTGYGEGGVVDITAELANRGLKPLLVTRFPLGVTSLTEQMRVARDAGADALVVYTVGPEEAAAAKSRHELGWKVPFFAPWPLSFRSVFEQAGAEALEGTMMAQTIIHDTANERRASFLARYFQHSNEKRIGSLMAAAQTYDAMHLMLFAMFQAQGTGQGKIDGDTLKQALENKERTYRGVVTTYESPFSKDDHDAFSVNMIWLGAWKRGEVVFHYADDAKRSSVFRRKE